MRVSVPNEFQSELRAETRESLRDLQTDTSVYLQKGIAREAVVRSMVDAGWSADFANWYTSALVAYDFCIELDYAKPRGEGAMYSGSASSLQAASVSNIEFRRKEPDPSWVQFFATDSHIRLPLNFGPLSENPFRLLNLPSNTPISQLRRFAERALARHKVGQSPETAFGEEFGVEQIEHIVQIVRTSAKEARQLCSQRIFWPFHEELLPATTHGTAPGPLGTPAIFICQADFIRSWIGFELSHEPQILARSLVRWDLLESSDDFEDAITAATSADAELHSDEAYRVVVEVEESITRLLLTRAIEVSISEFRSENYVRALEILRVALNSPVSPADQDRAVSLFIAWTDAEIVDLPEETETLQAIIDIIGDRHPRVKLWQEVVEGRAYESIEELRERAIDAANSREAYQEAIDLIEEALRMAPESLKARLRKDLSKLRELHQEATIWQDVQKIHSAPSLSTWNGVGTMLYGSEYFAGDPQMRFSILYFVCLYVPIFPLSRYLVTPVSTKQWRFHGRTRWTTGMRWHLAASMTVLLGLLVYGGVNANLNNETSQLQASPQSSEFVPTGQPESVSSSSSSVTYPDSSSERLDRLGKEYDRLEAEVKQIETQVDDGRASLEMHKEELGLLGSWIKAHPPDRTNSYEIDSYNQKVDSYEKIRRTYNRDVRAYNRKVNAMNAKIERAKAVASALKEGGS